MTYMYIFVKFSKGLYQVNTRSEYMYLLMIKYINKLINGILIFQMNLKNLNNAENINNMSSFYLEILKYWVYMKHKLIRSKNIRLEK